MWEEERARDRERAKERERSQPGSSWLLQAELAESDTSPCGWHMEPIVAAALDD